MTDAQQPRTEAGRHMLVALYDVMPNVPLLRSSAERFIADIEREAVEPPPPVDPRCGCSCHGPYTWDFCPHCEPESFPAASVPLPVDPREALDVLRRQPWFEDAAWDSADVIAALAASTPTAPPALDVDTLAAHLNDAQLDPDMFRLGHDLRVPAARILARLSGTEPGE